jgi:hypothetical protein
MLTQQVHNVTNQSTGQVGAKPPSSVATEVARPTTTTPGEFMPLSIRAITACVLLSSLAACVVTPPAAQAPRPTQQQIADQRLHQVNGRIDNLAHRTDNRVNQGYYPPAQGAALHHRLEVIRQEAHDMAAQHGGGLSSDEQRVLNQELDNAAHAIGE